MLCKGFETICGLAFPSSPLLRVSIPTYKNLLINLQICGEDNMTVLHKLHVCKLRASLANGDIYLRINAVLLLLAVITIFIPSNQNQENYQHQELS